jgi:hypothetical protein
MHPDERFRGRVEKVGTGIPWVWSVTDAKTNWTVARGEEFHQHLALRVCREATGSARCWHLYKRKKGELT